MRTNVGGVWVIAGLGLGLLGCSGASEPPKPAAPEAIAAPPAAEAPAPSAAAATAAAPASAAAATPPAPTPPPLPPHQGKCPAGMSEVPGGKFKSSYYRLEMTVAPYCIDVNLATTDEYKACVDAGKCDRSAVHACDPSTWDKPDRGKLPMICIDYDQAERYCKAQGKRVISDLEWEWVARNGDEARPYPWGADAPGDQLCWSGKEKRSLPCPIASHPPGPYGLYDLMGNVYQWTTTTNDSVSKFRGGRGGSWKDSSLELFKMSHRGGFNTTYRCGFLGIRCSMPVP